MSSESQSGCVIGATQLAVDCCQVAIKSGISITHVFTNDPTLKTWAASSYIATESVEQFGLHSTEFFNHFDFLFSIANDFIVPPHILQAVRIAPINYHNGPLPKYAGANAVHWTLINGESFHGVTWHIMNESIDSGSILVQEFFPIEQQEDILTVTLNCRAAAIRTFERLCKKLSTQLIFGDQCTLDKRSRHFIASQPSAFCLLPFQLSASKVRDFVRGTCTLGSISLQNLMGLAKVFLSPYSKPAIVKSLTILETKTAVAPGTCVDVQENIQVSTFDKDIKITEMIEMDGSIISKPFRDSIPLLKGQSLHLRCAHQKKSSLTQVSKRAAKCEKDWILQYSRTDFTSPLTWPYQTCLVSSSESSDCGQYEEILIVTLDSYAMSRLKNIIPQFEVEISALSAILIFLLAMSPTSSGSLDVYCNNIPKAHYGLLLTALPLSLSLKPGCCFEETMLQIVRMLHKLIVGKITNGLREDILAADVYLRYPGLFTTPDNTFALHLGACTPAFSKKHEVVVCSQLCEDKKVSIKAFVKTSVRHKYLFDGVKQDFITFLNSGLLGNIKEVICLPLCNEQSLDKVDKVLAGCQAKVEAKLVHEVIEHQAQLFPFVTAVIDEFSSHTYHDIMQYAIEISYSILQVCGAVKGLRIALFLDRNWEVIASMLGVLKAGACFVLVEANDQPDLLCRMLKNTGCHAVLVSSTRNVTSNLFNFDDFAALLKQSQIQLISLDLIRAGSFSFQADIPTVSPEDVAIIICTSGTTGKPKGVMLKHSSLCNYITNLIRVFELQGTFRHGQSINVGEYSLCCSSFNFDGSLHETLPILWLGGTLVFHPPNPALNSRVKFLFSRITFFFSQPTKLSIINASQFVSLRTLSIGGEAFTLELLKQWRCKGRSIWNVYGPCETTIGCCLGKIEDSIHLGSPVANAKMKILNLAGIQVPIGVPGELYVSGDGLSLGYTDSSLNKDAFWIDAQGERWYRTRDLVLLDNKDCLYFISRIPQDRQAKLHSIRLELSGIENVLRHLPGVQFAHVQIESVSNRLKRLVAYVSPMGLDVAEIKKALSRELPATSIPALIVPVVHSNVQLNKAGKLLLIKTGHNYGVTNFCPPSNKLEERVLQIYHDTLGISSSESFGMDSDLTEFGADSVAVMLLSTDLSESLRCQVSPQMVINSRTPKLLIKVLPGHLSQPRPAVCLQTESEQNFIPKSNFEEMHTQRSVSFFQEALTSMNSRIVGSAYNSSFVWLVSGSDGLQLAFAFEKILPLFHSAYDVERLIGKKPNSMCLRHVDLSCLSHTYQQVHDYAMQRVQIDTITPIDYKRCPYRATLYYLGSKNYLVNIVAHHIVFDQQTWTIISKTIENLYHNSDISLLTNLGAYSDYIAYEEQLYNEQKDQCLEFWRGCLQDCASFINFPTSFQRPMPICLYGRIYKASMSVEMSHKVTEMCAGLTSLSVRPVSFFLTLFGIVIHKLSKCSKFAIGVCLNKRTTKELESIIGMAIAVLPCSFPDSKVKGPLLDLVRHTSDWFWNASQYSSVPFLEITKLWCQDDHTRQHLPQFIYNFVSESPSDSNFARLFNAPTYTSKAELLLDVSVASDNSFSFMWEYNSSLFSEEYISEMTDFFFATVSSSLSNMLTKIEDITVPLCPSNGTIDTSIHISSSSTSQQLQPLSKHQSIIFRESLRDSIEYSACFHSKLSFKFESCTIGQAKELVLATLNMFPILKQVVFTSENDDKQFLINKADFTIFLVIESVKTKEEAFGVEHRIRTWPFDVINGPLFRCALLKHCDTTELLFVMHQVLLSEETLHAISCYIIKFAYNMSLLTNITDQPDVALKGPTNTQHTYSAESVIKSFLSCPKLPVSLSTSDTSYCTEILHAQVSQLREPFLFQTNSIDEYTAYCCAFTGHILSKMQNSEHVHFALYSLYKETEVTTNFCNCIVPICFDVSDEDTALKTATSIKSTIKTFYSKADQQKYSYWSVQEEINPYSSYLDPFHEVLVKILPTSINSDVVSVQSTLPFKLCFTFNPAAKEVTLTSSLNSQQTTAFHKHLKHCVQAHHDKILPDTRPSCIRGEEQTMQNADLQKMITLAFKKNLHSIAFCDIVEANNSCLYTYHEMERLSRELEIKIKNHSSQQGLIVIMISKGIMLPICLLACCLGNHPFTIIETTEKATITKDKLANLPVSLALLDVTTLESFKDFPFSQAVNCLIVEPYMDYKLLKLESKECLSFSFESESRKLYDTAFFVFTSGSTGKSKPTPVRKDSLLVFLEWFKKCAIDSCQLRCLQYSSYSFDVYIAEILTQFLCGSTSVYCDPNLRLDFPITSKVMTTFNIEVIFLVPTVLGMMLKSREFSSEKLPDLKHVFSAGEALPSKLCTQFFQKFPPNKKVTLHNWGGPAECCIAVAHSIINEQQCLSSVPIGYPIHNCEIQIVGLKTLRPVPCGFPGEIVVSGSSVFRGYYTNTATNSLENVNGKVWYRTGDIGFINTESQLVILKRIDSQVKLSGQRLDLDGIKALILDLHLPYLIDIIVDIMEINEVKQLVCFPLISDNVTEDIVQEHFATHLRSKFVPLVVKCMTQYPLLTSQKTNFRKLRKIAEEVMTSKASSIEDAHVPNINDKLFQAIQQLNPGVKVFDGQLPLDALGFNSVMKAQLHQMLLNHGFNISISCILSSRSVLELSSRLVSQPQPSLKESFKIQDTLSLSLSQESGTTAIIAMHVEVSGASSCEQLWKVLCNKTETIIHDLPLDSQTSAELNHMSTGRYVGSRGILPGKKLFDAFLFGVSLNEADRMDPQQRLLLQAVWTAFEQAGYDPAKFNELGKIGVFAGAQFPTYLFNLLQDKESQYSSRDMISWATLRDNVALRIGRFFDCRGPCVTYANNCATFMVALHHAHKSLLSQECDIAVVATATVSGQSSGYIFSEKDIYSKDGHCKPFSLSASGTVMSDGVTVLVLRRTEDAKLAEDDVICLVKGTSIGSDGSLARNGQLEPSAKGQMETLKQVFLVSGVDPASIGLVEAHGTGTLVGDQIELESLSSTFSQLPRVSCPIGSIKGNIGHTGVTAAGPAIVKAALAIQNAVIPPSINCDDPLPNMKHSPFFVNKINRQWSNSSCPKRALVHSVGALGTNSALILEEFLDRKPQTIKQGNNYYYPICISANSKYSFEQTIAEFAIRTSHNLKDISFSLLSTRRYLSHRAATTSKSLPDLKLWLSDMKGKDSHFCIANTSSNILLFGGQVSPVDPTIFLGLSELLPEFKQCVIEAFRVLSDNFSEQMNGCDLPKIIFDESSSHPALERPPFQHVLHVIAQIAIWKSLSYLGVQGDYFIGHSLGEYTAACVAGALSLTSVISIVFERGLLIEQYAPTGCMLSVSLSADEVQQFITPEFKGIEVSCYNSPSYSVVSGSLELVNNFAKMLSTASVKCRQLPISYAYHHSCMAIFQEKFANRLQKTTTTPLSKPLVTCSKGQCRVNPVGSQLSLEYWSLHLVTPCDFSSASKLLPTTDYLFIEVGMRPVLCNFISSPKCFPVCLSLHKREIAIGTSVTKDLTKLWEAGAQIQLHKLKIFNEAKRCKLPSYPFDVQEYWIDPTSEPTSPSAKHDETPCEVTVDSVLKEIRSFTGPGYENILPPDSLYCMQLRTRLWTLYKIDVIQQIENKATVVEIAEHIVEIFQQKNLKPSDSLQSVIVKLLSPKRLTSKPTLFVINAVDTKLHSFIPLATALYPSLQVYGVYAPTTILKYGTVEKYAEFYLSEIKKVQPNGPFLVGGFSFGAWIAHAIARKLLLEGEVISHLIMIDPPQFSTTSSENLYSLITLGLETVRSFTDSPNKTVICQYEDSFKAESRLLQKYQSSPKPVTCPVLVLLAEKRLASCMNTSSSPSLISAEVFQTWKPWCSSRCFNIKQIPGHHSTCVSSLNCSHTVKIIISIIDSPSSAEDFCIPLVPVPSAYEIAGQWKLKTMKAKGTTACEEIDDKFCSSSFLRVKNSGEFTCMIPLLPRLVRIKIFHAVFF